MEEKEEKNLFQKGFFEKLWYSITKIERYPGMAIEGVGRAIKYLFQIVSILAIVLSIWMTYDTSKGIKSGVEYLQNEFPDFSYSEGKLTVNSDEPIIFEDTEYNVGKVIIDTKTDSAEKIDEYTKSIEDNENGIVILNDKALIKTQANSISYDYNTIFNNMQITEFTKQNLLDYANSSQIISFYVSLFLTLFVYSLIMYVLSTIWYVLVISIIGYITAWLLKIKMRYAAVFNMSVYAISLSVILNMIYLIINMFVPFTIKYFQVMYIAVATIYLIAAIFIIKAETIKKQAELIKIAEAEAIIRKQMEEQKEQEEENKEDKEKKDKKDKKENKKDDKGDNGEEPQGSNA